MSALVTIEEDGVQQRWFIAPAGGGNVLGGGVAVVTPSSPLGKALLGKTHGESFELRGKAGLREMTIVDVW